MTDIFISYSRADRPRIEKLAAALEAEGFNVWWDRNLAAGSHFTRETEARLNEAKAVLVCWSKPSIESMWVADEASVGRDKRILVPIAIDEVSPPIGFRQIQVMPFADWRGDATAPSFKELVGALRTVTEGRAPEPPPAPRKATAQNRNATGVPTAVWIVGIIAIAIVSVVALGKSKDDDDRKPAVAAPSAPTAPVAAPEDVAGEQAGELANSSSKKSVAVLPFASLSAGADDGYFADGLTEEILNSLAAIDGLLVTARTSAFYFKGKDVPIPEIAETLGVGNIVEGSVRRDGDKVRISAQLIRAQDGFQLWSETFDRNAGDSFGVQSEIAEKIAAALGVLLDDESRRAMEEVGVRNVDAFINFQRGVTLYQNAHQIGDFDIPMMTEANAALDRAIAEFPEFSQAYLVRTDRNAHILIDIAAGKNYAGVTPQGYSLAEAERDLAADLAAASRYEKNPDRRSVIEANRIFLSTDWRDLGAAVRLAIKSGDPCRQDIWLSSAAFAVGELVAYHDFSKRGLECDPLDLFQIANGEIALGRLDEVERRLADNRGRQESERFYNFYSVSLKLARGEPVDPARVPAEYPIVRAIAHAAASDVAGARAVGEQIRKEGGPQSRLLIIAAATGEREEANRIAAAIDASPLGPQTLIVAEETCLCGALFDRSATPHLAARLAETGADYAPPAAIKFPLKNW